MRILLIEDDKWLVNALIFQLKKENYAVDTALDGDLGCELAWMNDYDGSTGHNCHVEARYQLFLSGITLLFLLGSSVRYHTFHDL